MKLKKNDENEAAYQMLRMTGLVVRETEKKNRIYFDECCYTNRRVNW